MKKALIAALAVLMILSLAACTAKKETGRSEKKAPETEEETGKGTERTETIPDGFGIVNPIVEVDSPDAFKDIGVNLVARPGAKNVVYSIIDGKIANIDFVYKGHEYTQRAAKTDEDISGLWGEVVHEENYYGGILREIRDGDDTYYSVTWKVDGVTYVLINTDGATEKDVIDAFLVGID